MDRKEYIKKLWNANTAIDIANILEDFENEVKNNVALGDVVRRSEQLLCCCDNPNAFKEMRRWQRNL